MQTRVRFAPSPTGFLHLGGVRTALFNWLFARHHQGKFILRIENTDRNRSREESIAEIIEGLKWVGIDWDEGPYLQTERQEIYAEHAERLLKEDKVYRCYCTPKELEEKRKIALSKGEKPRYDRRCRDLKTHPLNKPFSLRFKTPREGRIAVKDLLRGEVTFENKELDDLIILRSDHTPTYNFCVVVDDATMQITQIIRGDDHLANTPRQAHLYLALGYPLPEFVHIPLILGSDKTRLSKRHGATSILAYREEGFLPEAMVNYLVRLGWSHGDQEIFTLEELIQHFSLSKVGRSAAVFNPEKLLWLNSQYIKRSSSSSLARQLRDILQRKKMIAGEGLSLAEIEKVVPLFKERSKNLSEMANAAEFFFREDFSYEKEAREKFLTLQKLPCLKKILNLLVPLNPFNEEEIKNLFSDFVKREGIKLAELAQPLRVAFTGKKTSPGIYEIMMVLGKEKVIRRIKKAIEIINSKSFDG